MLTYRDKLASLDLGGPGSGHYGHSGRPGEVGGSSEGSGGLSGRAQRSQEIPAGTQGECFRNAASWVREHDDHTLVHGKVTNGHGRRFDHAWAETATTVADPTTGVRMPKDDWYDLVKAAPEARYSAEQAAINMLRTGNLGPWTAEEVGKRHLDLGGAGSGNFGHAGRPGEVGGSAPGDGTFTTSPPASHDAYFDDLDAEDRELVWKYSRAGSDVARVDRTPERGWPKEATARYQRQAATLDRIIEDAPALDAPAVVWRGEKDAFDLKPGDTFPIARHVSTSFNRDVALGFARNDEDDRRGSLLRIVTPHGLSVQKESKYGNERELLLPRNKTYRVVKVAPGGKQAANEIWLEEVDTPTHLGGQGSGDVDGHPFRGNQWSEGGGQARAKAGGEYGPNREWYPGGAFIATTEMPKRERDKIERLAKKDTELVDFGQRQKIEPGQIPIWRDVGATVNRDFTINETYLDKAGFDDEYKTQIREAASRARKGERLFDIKEFPALATVADVVRLIAADQPVPGDALDRVTRYRPDLGEYLVRAKTPTHLGGAGSGNFGHAGRPGEVGGSAPGDALPGSKASRASADRTSSPQFQRWFSDSKVVDEDGDPLRVYHGTTHDIAEFREAGGEGLNPESDWGAGVYFTSDPDDASENYAGEGPDLTSRLESRAEALMNDDEDLSQEAAMTAARTELAGKSPSVIPAYLSMQRPVVLGEPNGSSPAKETHFTMEYQYEDKDDPDSDIVGETGTLPAFLSTLREVVQERGDGSTDIVDHLSEHLSGEDYVSASRLVKLWKGSEIHIEHPETGQIINSEVFREALQRAGYDGVIDRTVDEKFGSNRKYGQKMKGVNPDTTHFVVFTPTQAKSAIGNKRFDPTNPAITMRYRDKLAALHLNDA